ncbi:MAG: hypothetical protein QME81_04375, partial [bacterium]|nr:hypothetical protein [bacterium]
PELLRKYKIADYARVEYNLARTEGIYYGLTFSPEAEKYLKDHIGNNLRLSWLEDAYFNGIASDMFSRKCLKLKGKAEDYMASIAAEKEPLTGDELRAVMPPTIDDLFGCALHPYLGATFAPVRYFKEDGSNGLPNGLAVMLHQVTPAGVKLIFYNRNNSVTKVYVTGRFYGTHRINSVREEGGGITKVGDHRVLLGIKPKSEAIVTLNLTRYRYAPSAKPWRPCKAAKDAITLNVER